MAFAIGLGATQNGSTVTSQYGQPGSSMGSYSFVPWVLSTMTFTATANTSPLSLNQVYLGTVPNAASAIMYFTDIQLTDMTAPVPEPSSLVLASLGLAAVALTMRRGKKKASADVE